MDIIAILKKPYTEEKYLKFINKYLNEQHCYIEETEENVKALKFNDEEIALQRKQDFEREFINTSLGNYRINPKGYSNAQQSIDVINNMIEKEGSLTSEIATLVIFYPTPDFTKPEQCTEEWLIENQYNITPMTKEEWDNFYKEFSRLYALKKYKGE